MPNVGFKLGLQANMDNLVNTTVAGSYGIFYLTSDTSRLYVGNSENKIVPVNAGIITVEAIGNLPQISGLSNTEKRALTGNYYYVKASNILCVFNGDNWVQINSVVTNSSMAQSTSAVEGGTKLTTSITDSKSNSVSANFDIKGADGITITGSGSVITVKGDPITVSTKTADNTATATIASTSKTTNASLAIKGGENVTVSNENNVITIKAEDRYVTKVNAIATSEGFNISTTDNKGNGSTAALLSPEIKLGSKEEIYKFANGVATLPVYTKSEVDGIKSGLETDFSNQLKAFNAMEYQGTVGGATLLPTEANNVKVGYAYLVSGDLNYNKKTYPSGTLVVATGTEGDNGYITGGTLDWSFVTGSTADTLYSGIVRADGAYALKPSTGGDDVASINVKAGTGITVSASGAENAKTQVYTINHEVYTGNSYNTNSDTSATTSAMKKLQEDYVIPVISGITVKNGHITGVSVTKHTVKDTNVRSISTAANVGITESAESKTATVTHATRLSNSNGDEIAPVQDASFSITSSSLAMTASGTNIAMNLEWGTF